MVEKENKEMQLKPKQALSGPAEQTTPGPVFTPSVDIFESEFDITLLADMPGVKPDRLNIDLRDNILTLTGDVQPFEGKNEEPLLTEYGVGRYYRQFTLSDVIDQENINAQLANGELRLTLPKVKKATPRRIEVKAG